MLDRRFLGKGTLRPEESHFNLLLQGQAGGHNLAEQARHLLVVEGAAVLFHYRTQHLGFPLWSVVGFIALLLLYFSNLLGAARARALIFSMIC